MDKPPPQYNVDEESEQNALQVVIICYNICKNGYGKKNKIITTSSNP